MNCENVAARESLWRADYGKDGVGEDGWFCIMFD